MIIGLKVNGSNEASAWTLRIQKDRNNRGRAVTRQKGLALVLVLWVLSLLTIMAGSFALSMRREAAIVAGIKNNAQALAIAESGIAIAQRMLMNPDQNKRWRTDGSIYQVEFTSSNGTGSRFEFRCYPKQVK